MFYAPGNIAITDGEDIDKIAELLQSMKINKAISGGKDSYAFMLNLFDNSGEKTQITISSNRVIIDGKSYKCDEIADKYSEPPVVKE